MANLLWIVLLCLSLGSASAVMADAEIHVIAVGKGHETDDYYALPEAHVLVDRPGQEVSLVLLDGGDLRWRVEATQGTFITQILLGGPRPQDSKVMLFGTPMMGVQTAGLPLVYHPHGQEFRALVKDLTDRLSAPRLHSFQATHKARDVPLRIDAVDTITPQLARNYLSDLLHDSGDLPSALRRWISTGDAFQTHSVLFDESGFTLIGPNERRHFPRPLEMPAILLPVGGLYSPDHQELYGLSYGAEGYVYAVDAASGAWRVITSLHGYDAAAMHFDADSRQVILTGAFSRPGDVRIIGLDGSIHASFVPATGFPGLSDLSDFGNEHGPPLVPRAYSEGWLLLSAEGQGNAHRLYALKPKTGEVRLLRYHDD